MRALLTAIGLATLLATPARADACGDLIAKVVAGTDATLTRRTADFAELSGSDGMNLTIACGDLSAVGVQFRGPSLPEGYFGLFARASHATTGIAVAELEAAARKAREGAVATRHSNVDAGNVLVTCSVSGAAPATITACAAIDRDEPR